MTHVCPHCARSVAARATRCRHCRREIKPDTGDLRQREQACRALAEFYEEETHERTLTIQGKDGVWRQA